MLLTRSWQGVLMDWSVISASVPVGVMLVVGLIALKKAKNEND